MLRGGLNLTVLIYRIKRYFTWLGYLATKATKINKNMKKRKNNKNYFNLNFYSKNKICGNGQNYTQNKIN